MYKQKIDQEYLDLYNGVSEIANGLDQSLKDLRKELDSSNKDSSYSKGKAFAYSDSLNILSQFQLKFRSDLNSQLEAKRIKDLGRVDWRILNLVLGFCFGALSMLLLIG